MTSDSDKQLLLHIAREAIEAHVTGRAEVEVEAGTLGDRYGGAFVTVLKEWELRGCIGHIEANEPLPHVVARCAVAACSADPRFPPVDSSELALLSIELSLLGPLEPISGPEQVEIGRHGLVVEDGLRRGLLLPQVATEWRMGPEQFLAQTCRKAGLALDAWKRGAKLWRFQAEVFGERAREHGGN